MCFLTETFYTSNAEIANMISLVVMLTCFAISVGHLSLFAWSTVNQIAAHLNISVFTIKPKEYNNLETV